MRIDERECSPEVKLYELTYMIRPSSVMPITGAIICSDNRKYTKTYATYELCTYLFILLVKFEYNTDNESECYFEVYC